MAINGHNTTQQPLETQSIPATLATPSSTASELPPTSSSSASTDCTTEEDMTTSDNDSITLIASDGQLRPHIPISYNETVLKCLYGLPQIRTLNNISFNFQLTVLQKTQIPKTQMKKMNITYEHSVSFITEPIVQYSIL